MYPRLEIDIVKLQENVKAISKLLKKEKLSFTMVTKAYCADAYILSELVKTNLIDYLADSRIENLKSMQEISIPKILLRIPMHSEISKVIDYADISFNSEYETITKLNEEAKKQNKVHKIVLMVDLGDLREGFFEEKDLFENIHKMKELSNIEIIGLATNLTCYGAILPSEENLSRLLEIAKKIENQYHLQFDMISGGNSSSLFLIEQGKLPKGINNLRIGEAVLLGRETAFGEQIENTFDDAFSLVCEIVETKKKPSLPIGEQGMDAFGQKPSFEDKGMMQRAIVAIGRQDITIDSIEAVDKNITVIGASSDHTILDISHTKQPYEVGDTVRFKLGYSGIMSACTSKYVKKYYIK